MEIDRYCQRRNCSPLNALFSYVLVTLISQGVHTQRGVKQVQGWEMRRTHSPVGATTAEFFVGIIFLCSDNKKTSITIYLSIYVYSSNNKQTICNTTKQDSETEILNTALTQHKHKSN